MVRQLEPELARARAFQPQRRSLTDFRSDVEACLSILIGQTRTERSDLIQSVATQARLSLDVAESAVSAFIDTAVFISWTPRAVDSAADYQARSRLETDRGDTVTVTSTEAKNSFGRVLVETADKKDVVITRHDQPEAVVLSYKRYTALVSRDIGLTESLTREFDALYARMQTSAAVEEADDLFTASDEEIGRVVFGGAR